VRGLASADYPEAVIEAWAPLPITAEHVAFVASNPDNETRLVAELDGTIVGLGCLVASESELRACYVRPSFARRGVGSAILHEIENAARRLGLSVLHADSSLTAEAFYRIHGYDLCGRGEHALRGGVTMACVKMRKNLAARDPSPRRVVA
jgi:putative acetyltransferase